MVDGSLLLGPVAILTGLFFYTTGSGKLESRVPSAGRFDFAVGASLAGYGAVVIWHGLRRFGHHYPEFFVYLLGGLYLARTHYVLSPGVERRTRDLLNAALLGVPGAGGLFGILWDGNVVFYSFLPAIPAVLCGLLLLLYDFTRVLREKEVYPRDVLTAFAALPLLFVYLFLVIGALAGLPP